MDAVIALGYDYNSDDSNSYHWLYSYDGINFLSFAKSGKNDTFTNICYVNGMYVVEHLYYPSVSSTWSLRYSTDAKNWIDTSVGNVQDIQYGNGTFMSTASRYDSGWNLYIYTSGDGRTWTKRGPISGDSSGVFGRIVYTNDKWVCCNERQICESRDNGQTWTNYRDLAFRCASISIGGFTYGDGYFWMYACNGYSYGNGYSYSIYRSQNGADWTLFRGLPQYQDGICFFKNKLYCYSGRDIYIYDPSVPEPWVKFTSCSTNQCNQSVQHNLAPEGDFRQEYFTIDSSKFPAPNANGEYEINLEMLAAKITYASLSYTYYDNTLVTRTRNNRNKIIGSISDSTLQNLTNNACTKLKSSGARVYVVGYRYTSSNLPTYLKNCATDSGGKSYAVTTEVKTTLNEIASEIKTWGEYQEARLVN